MGALCEIVSVEDLAPADCGANFSSIVQDPVLAGTGVPTAQVPPAVMNSVLLVLMALMFRLPAPVLASVTVCAELWVVVAIAPKLSEDGETLAVACAPATPLPERLIAMLVCAGSLVEIVRLPLRLPAAWGAKATLIEQLLYLAVLTL